ncbi:unnamed protein product [Ilex paraguariensis]|uniref:Uncharacterized protein n=1 Tax=Ilex paraguariensis TaxID=185542 RepID=A0ABC8UNE2_9AQUA
MGLLDVGFSSSPQLFPYLSKGLRHLVLHVCISFPRSLWKRFSRLHVSRRNSPKVVEQSENVDGWGLSSFPFGLVECLLKYLGSSTFVFNVTSKEVENEQNKQYEQRIFEFRVTSPVFLPITTAAIINLISFFRGIVQVWRFASFEKQFRQMFLAGFVVLNSWPVYEGLVLITDKGKMPMKVKIDINDSC